MRNSASAIPITMEFGIAKVFTSPWNCPKGPFCVVCFLPEKGEKGLPGNLPLASWANPHLDQKEPSFSLFQDEIQICHVVGIVCKTQIYLTNYNIN